MPMPPSRFKVVRQLHLPGPGDRLRCLADAGYQLDRLEASQIFLDFSSAAPCALSEDQWAAMQRGDEAYAGSRSFQELEKSVADVWGLPFTIPAHGGRAAEQLVIRHLVKPGTRVIGNPVPAGTLRGIVEAGGCFQLAAQPKAYAYADPEPFKGDPDLTSLEASCDERRLIWIAATSDVPGWAPVSLETMRRLHGWAREEGVLVVLDASHLALNAWLVRQHEGLSLPVSALMAEFAGCADVVFAGGRAGGLAHTGGWVATADPVLRDHLRNLCVIYEGMPFYGGVSGRDLEALALGLRESTEVALLAAHAGSVDVLTRSLRAGGVPLVEPAGGRGVALDLERWGRGVDPRAVQAALYLIAGVKVGISEAAAELGMADPVVQVSLPWRSYDLAHLRWVAEAVIACYLQADRLPRLIHAGHGRELGKLPVFLPDRPFELDALDATDPPWATVPPFRGKVVECLPQLDRAAREDALREAGYNMFLLSAQAIVLDAFTDSGTNAMSDVAWGAMTVADEAPGDHGFEAFGRAVSRAYGYPLALPAHQGRGAEALLMQAIITPERPLVVGNSIFITTHGHLVRAGGRFEDVTASEDLFEARPFKGDLDLERLDRTISEHGSRIAFLHVALTVNATGGQPVRLGNLRAVRERSLAHGIPLYLDATRAVENAFFVREQEPGYQARSLASLLRETADLSDGATVSGKKDLLTHIGGFLATRDRALAERAWQISERQLGDPRTGGLPQRDLFAMRQGLIEMLDEGTVTHRLMQVRAMGIELRRHGLPLVVPIGGHAIFLDASAFLPHLSPGDQPGHALAAALYLQSGIRGMRIKTATGADLLRLCWPRRVYGVAHAEALVEALRALWERRGEVLGLQVVSQPAAMRATLSRYQPFEA